MKKLTQIISYSFAALVLTLAAQLSVAAEQTTVSGTTLELNGLGVHSELRNEWFLNGLYLVNKTDDADEAITSSGAKRMEIKVLADNLSGRRLKRFWIERIKNNNEASNVLANAKSVRDFATVMDQDLVSGDVVTIDLLPSVATVISINGSEVGRTDPEAFALILRTWIGERPPSSEFKDAILGDISGAQRADLVARFAEIQPSSSRIAKFDQAAIAAREEEERKQREEEERKQRELEQQQLLEEQAKIAEQEKQLEEQKKQAEAEQQAEENAEAERLRLELEEAKRQLAEQQKAAEEAQKAQGPTAAELASMREQYSGELGAHYVPYFEYPQRDILRRHGKSALMRPREGKTHGNVSISIEVDRDGELVGGSLVSSSGEKILDDAVMNALFDSVPFPAMPENLPGETFKTTVSISIPAPQM
ncbi:TonB family protein [Kangiella geojedonensis]|uniref:TonB family protein n=1 Tax=Kangiella geojedonensis TaxID=914150 RepID=A0A0F6RCR0_9GAMM|nr:TonB family protein [Kangiella geojedonensis]AKE52256.1 TonB family protein [Kangiella geojedonensis]